MGELAPPSEPSTRPIAFAPKIVIPLIGQVEALFARGMPTEALGLAYRTAEDDVRRAFAVTVPAQWTHRQFLSQFLRSDMGYVAVLLPQLYALYEPVRYGGRTDVPREQVMELLRALYREPVMANLPPALPPRANAATAEARTRPRNGRAKTWGVEG